MNGADLRKRVLRRVNQLASDQSTAIEGRVTATSIDEAIDDIYRRELCPMFTDKFPDLFKPTLTPFTTNTTSATVAVGSTAYTLVTTADKFTLNDVGYSVYNLTTGETATITDYTSATTVTVSLSIGDTWDGHTIYLLGNEYLLSSNVETVEIKEVETLRIKYDGTDSNWTIATRMDEKDAKANGGFSRQYPVWYLTSKLDANKSPEPAIGILPFPNNFDGLIQLECTIIPAKLTDTTSPVLVIPGIDLAIYNGATAIALRDLDMFDKADVFQGLYNSQKALMLRSFKPKSRSGASQLRMSSTSNLMRSRRV